MPKFNIDDLSSEMLTILREDTTPDIPWNVKDLLTTMSNKAGDEFVLEKKDINSTLYTLLKKKKVIKLTKFSNSTPLWKLNQIG